MREKLFRLIRTHATSPQTGWQEQAARLEKRLTAFQALSDIARSLTSELNLDQLLGQILFYAVQVADAGAGSLLLFDSVTQELVFRVVEGGAGEPLRGTRIRSDQGIAGWVFTHREPVLVNNVNRDPRFDRSISKSLDYETFSLIAAPLIYKDDAIGVVEVLNKKSGEGFSRDDQELLGAFAAQSAVAIQNAQLYQQVVDERDRILTVEAQVRLELARDLHDGPLQLLSAIIMGLQFLKQVVTREPNQAQTEVEELERMSAQALQQVRSLQFNLRPVILETQGLRAAIEFYVERERHARGTPIHLDTDGFTARFSSKAEAAIFSIVQEAIGNALKHASANNIWVSTRQDAGHVVITIQDDGSGFDLSSIEDSYAQRGSMGLLNINERAQIAAGKLTIDSQPGRGTLVTLTIPAEESSHK